MTTRLVGINHVALEVEDIERSLAFYGQLFELRLRGRTRGAAFVDIGDQFLALMQGRSQSADVTETTPSLGPSASVTICRPARARILTATFRALTAAAPAPVPCSGRR